jgi:hypothetical protein
MGYIRNDIISFIVKLLTYTYFYSKEINNLLFLRGEDEFRWRCSCSPTSFPQVLKIIFRPIRFNYEQEDYDLDI